ncbi:suppressor of glycerol defect [Xanthoria calcicola]
MYRSDHKTTTLPRSLREEIGIEESSARSKRKQHTPAIRKERRKPARTEKKVHTPQRKPKFSDKRQVASTPKSQSKIVADERRESIDQLPSRKSNGDLPPKSILKSPKQKDILPDDDGSSLPLYPSRKPISRGVKDRLVADDAEIAALEKALGIKDKKKLPKAFEEDGLDDLLGGLGDDLSHDEIRSKRKRDDGEEWLERKRMKARGVDREPITMDPSAIDDSEGTGGSFDGLSDPEMGNEDQDRNEGLSTGSESNDDSMFEDSSSSSSDVVPGEDRIRENPYRAPVTAEAAAPKYTPPSLRNQTPSETEDLSRLRRKVQGLINRLSDANLISILGNVESLYQNNPRQHVSLTLLDLLLGLLSDPASLQDTFVILHAGFITAVYKMIGPDFGAQVIQRIDEEFRLSLDVGKDDERPGKKLMNLASLLSSLYTFQVVGSKLIYDYIKMFVEDLSEDKVELLLKILRNSGPQLRQDDPSALKEIVLLVQNAVGRIGEQNLSVRTKFMIETINDLKNNRMKTGIAASTIMSEHVIRMKKTLGSLNTRSVKASEPLMIGVSDIRESDQRGKWWLIGASYKDPVDNRQDNIVLPDKARSQDSRESADELLQMARDQGMNTSVRQSIFKIIMSASDYNNAFQLLMNLRLKKTQEPEIAKVIMHCAGVEQAYNPYYSLLARRLCASRGNYKMAFQFSLWGIFKRLGDGPDDEQYEAQEDRETLPMRNVVNLAKMFGTLVAEGGLTLNILKVLNFPYLQPKTSIFVELMMIAIILHSQKGVSGSRDESRVIETFVQANGNPGMAQGLQRFLKKTVSRTDVAGTKADNETVKWGCRVAQNALDAVVSLGDREGVGA